MNDNLSHLAFRIMVSTGIELIQTQQKKNRSAVSSDPNRPLDLADKTACYDRLFQLEGHEDKRQKDDQLSKFNINVALMLQLAKRCGFLPSDGDKKLEHLCGRTLLKHYLQIFINSHALAVPMFIGDGNGTVAIAKYGAAIYMLSSMFEHGCEPNIEYHQALSPPVLIQRATRRIKAGEKLLIDYHTHFQVANCPERKELLQSQYFFLCECDRCVMECRDGFEDGALYYPVACDKCG